MRTLKTNHIITVLGQKIGNTYIKSEDCNTYPLTDTKYSKGYKDYKKYWWVLKRCYFKWRVLKVFQIN